MIGVQARIICSACPGGNLPQNQKPSYRRYRRLKNPDDDVIIIHNVGERRAIYCAPGKLASVSHWICPVLVPDGRCNVSSRIIYNQVISHFRYVTNAGHVWGHVARRKPSTDLVTWSLASCSSGPSDQLDHMTYTQFLTFSILYRFQHWEVEKYTANFKYMFKELYNNNFNSARHN